MVAGRSAPTASCMPPFRAEVGESLLKAPQGCAAVLNDLLETAPADMGRMSLAVLNLLSSAPRRCPVARTSTSPSVWPASTV